MARLKALEEKKRVSDAEGIVIEGEKVDQASTVTLHGEKEMEKKTSEKI
jgi:hypothetical protein